MTVHTLKTNIPEIEIGEGMILRLEAISPTTGAAITGVTARNWAVYGLDLSDVIVGDLELVIPPLTPEEVIFD